MERALTPLQQAYLLGRSEHVPLGGVAMQLFREYRGQVDGDRLRARLLGLVERHECLRLRIDTQKLVQTISPVPELNFEEVDLRSSTRSAALQKIEGLRDGFAHEQCDLAFSPWKVVLFLLPPPANGEPDSDTEVVFVRFDAQCVDGQALSLLLVELFGADEGRVMPASPTVEVRAPGKEVDSATRERDAAYWADKLGRVDGAPRLPWQKPLESIKVARYERKTLCVSRERLSKLTRVGARGVLFRNSTLSALIMEVLSCWLSDGSLTVAVPVAPPMDGPLANRSSFIAVTWDSTAGTLTDRAKTLQQDVLEGLEHLSFSGVDLTRQLVNAHGDWPALPVVITNGLSWPRLGKDSPVRLHTGLSQTPQVALDVRLGLSPAGDLVIDMDFAREALPGAVVSAMLAALDRAIVLVCERGELEFQRREVLDLGHYWGNACTSECPGLDYLQRIADHLFVGQNERTALICDGARMSYAELGVAVAKAMASLAAAGVEQGDVVALYLPRSPEHMVLSLACALRGAVWVPIDASTPPARLAYLLENCQPKLVVTPGAQGHQQPVPGFQSATVGSLLSGERPADPLALTPPLQALSLSEAAAYYLYTSGTTGKPKCVVLSNRSTGNVLARTNARWGVTQEDVFISVTPMHHDMSVVELFGCFSAGATLVVPGRGEDRDAVRWNQLVAEHGVTIWTSVPAIFEMLLSCRRGDSLRSLRLVSQGGDYVKPAVIAELRRTAPEVRLFSIGGPTETTIWSIWHEIGPEDVDVIPYGLPVHDNQYYILNERGEHCPVGVVGRIYTAGVNVARGYLDHGTLIQQDFVTIEDEHGKPVRAFRTGDRGRYRADGLIVFAGRVDGYVKVRGVRVSLPDIEKEISKHPAVQQLIVVAYGAEVQGETAIGVLYVPRPEQDLSAAALRDFARQQLPGSHVPSRLLKLEQMPLSANGKPDRRRGRELLLALNQSDSAGESANKLEQSLLEIYRGVLGKPAHSELTSATDFMSVGLLPSHLKAISTRIRQELGVALSPQQLLRCRNANQVQQLFQAQKA